MTGKLIDTLNQQVCIMEYSDSAVFDYSPQHVFDVVADIENYPEFLPGWISAHIVKRRGNVLTAEQELGFGFLNWRFTSEAILESPYHIHITSLKGPFMQLDIDWAFCPLDRGSTRVSLDIKSDSAPGPQHRFLHGILTNAARSLLDCFKERMGQVTCDKNPSQQ